MTELIGHQGHGDGGLDMLAVARDADLLDLLASRADLPAAGDPVLELLASFAADVDAGLDELLVALDDDPLHEAAGTSATVHDLSTVRRGHGLRATTVVVVVGATLSLGGVAAAVTGDPLAPVKGIVSAVTGSVGHHDDPVAHADKKLADGVVKDARGRITSGDYAGAQARMDQLRTRLARLDLTAGERHSLEGQLKALENQLLAATRDGGNANGADNGHQDDVATGGGDEQGDQPATAGKPTDQARTSKPDKPASGGQQSGSQGSGSQGSGGQGSGGQGSGGQGSGGQGSGGQGTGDPQTGRGGAAGTGDASTAPRPRPSQAGQGATTDPSSGAGNDSSAPAPSAAPAHDPAPGADGGNGDGASQDGAKGGAQGATTRENGAADASAQD